MTKPDIPNSHQEQKQCWDLQSQMIILRSKKNGEMKTRKISRIMPYIKSGTQSGLFQILTVKLKDKIEKLQ